MEMEKVETDVDRMMSILENGEKISLIDLSKQLGVPESNLQLWIDFLVEEMVLGIEYKFTTPYVFMNKKHEDVIVIDEVPELSFFKKKFFDAAKKRAIPENRVLDLWRNHLNEIIEKQKEFFFREVKKRGFHNANTLYIKYKNNLLSA